MSGWRWRKRAMVLFTLCTTAAAEAQVAPGVVVQESNRIQREQEQRRQEQIARDRRSAVPPSRLQPADSVGAKATAPNAVCRPIRDVQISGTRRVEPSAIQFIEHHYEGRCLGVSDIEHILGDVTKLYIDAGYVSSRAYLPQQDLNTGTLRIVVVEGRLSRIEIPSKRKSVNTATAFPGLVGRPVNLRAIEQGLDQINRLASNHATIDLQPGAAEGDTILIIRNAPGRHLRGNLALDNSGSRATGIYNGALTISGDDLLGLNDFMSVTRRQSAPFSNQARGKSSSETYFASLPFGALTVSGGITKSRYRSRSLTQSGLALILSGDSLTHFMAADLVLRRSRTGQVALSGTLTTRDNDNFLDGERLQVTSRKLTVGDVDLNIQTSKLGGFATLDLGASFGLKMLGALRDQPGLTADQPRAQFVKFRAAASYFNSATIGGKRIEFVSSLAAQYSGDRLFGSEQFSIGGLYSVRGFRESTLADDNGVFFRNDVAAPMTVARIAGLPMVLRPYFGVDVGHVGSSPASGAGGTLAGAAAGASLSWGRLFIDVFAARRLHAPVQLAHEGTLVFGRMAIKL